MNWMREEKEMILNVSVMLTTEDKLRQVLFFGCNEQS